MNAQHFYNVVVLMRANQKNYLRLSSKQDRTPEEEELRKRYLSNATDFETMIDNEIVRVQGIIEKEQAARSG